MLQILQIFDAVIFLIFLCSSLYFFYTWKSVYDPIAKWLFLIAAAFALLSAWRYFSHYILLLNGSAAQYNHYFLSTLDTIFLIAYVVTYYLGYKYVRDKKSFKDFSDKELLWYYMYYAKTFGKRLAKGDAIVLEEGKGEMRMVWATYNEMRRRDANLSALIPMLTNSNCFVRTIAARQRLWIDTERSLKILDEMGEKKGEIANLAKGMAADWRANKIAPDPIIPDKLSTAKESSQTS